MAVGMDKAEVERALDAQKAEHSARARVLPPPHSTIMIETGC
jgi:hypothetical protein